MAAATVAAEAPTTIAVTTTTTKTKTVKHRQGPPRAKRMRRESPVRGGDDKTTATKVTAAITGEFPTITDGEWTDLCSTVELSCVVTLTSGQVFTWQRETASSTWIGVIDRQVFRLREHDARVQFQCLHPPSLPTDEAALVLGDYFRLEINAAELYRRWAEPDDAMSAVIRRLPGLRIIRQDPVECLFAFICSSMSAVIRRLPGLRIIRQDPVECLFAFICSSNNNIPRITQLVTKLKATYGERLYPPEEDNKDNVHGLGLFAFPTVEALATRVDEETLRGLGFGYRAPFIVKSSQLLQDKGGRSFLLGLRGAEAEHCANELMAFAGVGRKVADCIGLFSLDQLEAIPVDTHVWQIACREFALSLRDKKSLTPTIYGAIGGHFRQRFSPMAGWAHSVLFTGDLASFQSTLGPDVVAKRPRPTNKRVRRAAAKEEAKEEDEEGQQALSTVTATVASLMPSVHKQQQPRSAITHNDDMLTAMAAVSDMTCREKI